jgi:HPt (histidine-containing phosphotransfer) domain-containing protein
MSNMQDGKIDHSYPAGLEADAAAGVFAPHSLLAAAGSSGKAVKVVLDVIRDMVSAGVAPIQDVQRQLQMGQTREAAEALHSLRGGLGSLGTRRLVAAASALEQAIAEQRDGDYAALATRAKDELQAVVEAASAWLQQQDVEQTREQTRQRNAAPIREAASPERMALLLRCLDENNMQAGMLYDELRPALQDQLSRLQWRALELAISELRFADALQILRFDAAT